MIELAMDGCGSWLPALQGGGIGHGDAASELSYGGSELQDLPTISYQVEEQLQQIYLLMGMEEHDGRRQAEDAPPSSQSTAFRSFSGSPSEASSFIMPGSCSTNSRRHTPEAVSSLKDIPLSPVTFGGGAYHYGQCYGSNNLLDNTIYQNMEQFRCQESHHHEHAQRKNSGRYCGAGAFVPYSRHLSAKKKPSRPPGSGGQKAIKAAISALARMHTVRLAQWRRQQCYQMEMAVAPPAGTNNSCNQLQHVLSERKRREKLNDSFKALKTVLPPAPEKDKASILTRARDYVNTLKSRVAELEERNRMLVELQRHRNNGVGGDFVSGEEIEVNIDRATAEEMSSQEVHLKVVVRSGCSAMDAVVGILECLKEIGDVRLAAMDTGNRATTLTLQMKTSRRDDNFLKESVIKSVRGVMQSKIETS